MNDPVTQYPLDGLRVIDISQTLAGAYAGKMLCDAGSEVIVVEPPQGNYLRGWKKSALLGESAPLAAGEDGALFHYLHGNKKSITVDSQLDGDRQRLKNLCVNADMIISDSRSAFAAQYELDFESLKSINPKLSLIEISPYGRDDPTNATEFTLQADVGSTDFRGYADRLPVAVGGQLAEYLVATFTAVAALTAWLLTHRHAKGQDVDLSMFEAILLTFQPYQYMHEQIEPGVLFPREVDVPSVEPAKDGWVGFCIITAQQWLAFTKMIDCPELAELTNQPLRFQQADRVLEIIHRWTRARTTEEILQQAEIYRIPAVPVGDGESVFSMTHLQERGVFVSNPAGFKQPRVPYQLGASRTRTAGKGPQKGQHNNVAFEPHKETVNNRPVEPINFEGLRIVDLSAFWAGPIAGTYFANLGAEVIKVESIARPDGMRFASGFSPGFTPNIPLWESSGIVHGANSGKYGITLDLTKDRGRELLAELIKKADVVIENFSPRVMENFGFGWDEVHTLNPKVIMVRMPAFGLDGPWRNRTGFAMNIEQVSGMAALTGYPDRAPLVPKGCVDPLGGMQAAFATLCALQVRQKTGKGQLVEVPLLESGLSIAAEPIIEYSAYGTILNRIGNKAAHALQGIFRCKHGELIALSIENDNQFSLLISLLDSEQLRAFKNCDTAQRFQNEKQINAVLQEYFENKDAKDTIILLQANGLAIARLNNSRELLTHPRLTQRGYFTQVKHSVVGPLKYPNFPFKVNGEYLPIVRPAPCLGEHNQKFLGGLLGLSEAELEQLRADEIIGDRPSFM